MFYGLVSGMLWGGNAILLGIILSMSPFVSTKEAIFLAPFVSAFLVDGFSSIWISLYMGVKKQLLSAIRAVDTRSGRCIVISAVFAGPVGMTANLVSMQYIGPAYVALITSLYPAVGAVLSYIFLKEKMKPLAIIGLIISLVGIVILGYAPGEQVNNFTLGLVWASIAVLGWACEGVICSYGMRGNEINPIQSLQVRQLTSALVYGCLIIPLVGGIKFTMNILATQTVPIIILTALSGTIAYMFYYKGIRKIGATKAMTLGNTCSAWSLFFGIVLLGNSIDVKSIICCGLIMVGSILAGIN